MTQPTTSQYLIALAAVLAVVILKGIIRHTAIKMDSTPSKDQWAISPFFRVLLALFVAAFAYLIWLKSVALFSVAGGVTPANCDNERRVVAKLLCNISNSLLSSIPQHLQGPANGAAGILFVLPLLYAIWHLLKPVFKKRRK